MEENTQEIINDDRGEWYIVHTYSGQEERVKKNLEQRIQSLDMAHKIFQVVVPTVEELVVKDGKRKQERKKVFPGYILVQMDLADDSYSVVRNTPAVTGFVSTEDEIEKRPKPVPLEPAEVAGILKHIRADAPDINIGYKSGQSVRITSGPFADFIGVVNEVDITKGKLKVLVSFFDRETPVELDFLQVAEA